jgi:hypothetical protein
MNIHTVRGSMDEMFQALMLFWLPVAVVPLGVWIWLSSSNDQRKSFGRILSFIGLVMVCVSPWTAPSSPSTAAGHLLGAIIGPSVLIILGIYLISFSGHVPVGRLPRSDRRLGIILSSVGFSWFAGMHWWILTPQIASGEINVYWYVFWPNFLLLTSCLSSLAAIALLTIGDERKNESNYMFLLSGLGFIMILLGLNVDGPLMTTDDFREHLWLAVADLAGLAVGSMLSILMFALVIFVYEKTLPPPVRIEAPNGTELKQVAGVIASHIGGNEE